MSAALALAAAAALAGCGSTTYFDGRKLPPSGLMNRVMIAIQNPSALTKGALEIVDAYYDIRAAYNSTSPGVPAFSISGYAGALPTTIQNDPEEQFGVIYGSGDNSFTYINYQTESSTGSVSGLSGASTSVFSTRDQKFVFAANSNLLTIVDKSSTGAGTYYLSLPGISHLSVNPGGSAVLAFTNTSGNGQDNAYYPVKLNAAQTIAYSAGSSAWPKAAVDCEPQNAPGWCLMQMQSPDNTDSYGLTYGAPLTFDRPVKAIFSSDGSTAYVLNCGAECGGNASSVSILPVAPILFTPNQASGKLPTTATLASSTIALSKVSAGASNALLSGTLLYVMGQYPQTIGGQTYFGGTLTTIDLTTNKMGAVYGISDGAPGLMTRMIPGDDNTLWIATQQCSTGVRAETGLSTGCLDMVTLNPSTGAISSVLVEPYPGGNTGVISATGIAAVTGLHKIYAVEGGQVYIYSTTNGTALDNQYVTVTGTAYDVAYMDATTDANNTVY